MKDPIVQQKNILDSSAKSQNDKKNTKPQENIQKTTPTKQQTNSGKFSINDIKLGEKYTGYVKLLYNYGIFVTVK